MRAIDHQELGHTAREVPRHFTRVGFLLIVSSVALLAFVSPLAYASPPDSTWICGLYDAGDGDDAILALLSASEVLGPVSAFRIHTADAGTPAPEDRPPACVGRPMPTARGRAPPHDGLVSRQAASPRCLVHTLVCRLDSPRTDARVSLAPSSPHSEIARDLAMQLDGSETQADVEELVNGPDDSLGAC